MKMRGLSLSLKGRDPWAGIRIIGALVVANALILGLFELPRAEARQIDNIIVHHTASEDVSAITIDAWHLKRGWDGIGYHFVIRSNGTVEPGRSIEKIGAHAKGRNAHSIGIALTGYDEFTLEQKTALTKLIKELCKKYPIESIERHHEECPGTGLDIESLAKYILKK